MSKQRKIISEGKLRIRGIHKEIADLKYERHCVECVIEQAELFIKTCESDLTKKWKKNLKRGQRNKNDYILKAIMNVN